MLTIDGGWLWMAMGTLGVLVGSFLNVVIHRVPLMLERRWAAECAELSDRQDDSVTPPYNLWRPTSRCPHCHHPIRWFENIPLLSYVGLKGRCSACKNRIGLRYPLVEMLTGAVFAALAWRWGLSSHTVALCGYSAALIALAFIDWDTTLLPDAITLPLVWAGLFVAATGLGSSDLLASFWGAVIGYLSLWGIYWLFKLITGKEGMGYGDFKLLAAIGAWLGWQALLPVILLSSISGVVAGLILKARAELREGAYVPFGPCLAFGGIVLVLIPEASLWWP